MRTCQRRADPNGPVRVEELEDGGFWRVRLAAPKANILDGAMIEGLTRVFDNARQAENLKAVCLHGEGAHFSFGASVEEHLPDNVEQMLTSFHGLFRAMASASVPLLAAVRGQCLGGGLEVAAFCHRVFAAPDARLGQPEIRLGVFAPVASVILPERIGRGPTDDLCLSGRVITAEQARAIGLVDEVAEDPYEAALIWARELLLTHSAASLRCAVRAARHGFHERFLREIDAVERLYLEELMATADAEEGIRSFLEKRKPRWRNR